METPPAARPPQRRSPLALGLIWLITCVLAFLAGMALNGKVVGIHDAHNAMAMQQARDLLKQGRTDFVIAAMDAYCENDGRFIPAMYMLQIFVDYRAHAREPKAQ